MPPAADARAGRVAFTHPAFTLFQIARFMIVAATEMQAVAVGWQVYEITKRPLDLGLVGLAQFLPGISCFWFPVTRRIGIRVARYSSSAIVDLRSARARCSFSLCAACIPFTRSSP